MIVARRSSVRLIVGDSDTSRPAADNHANSRPKLFTRHVAVDRFAAVAESGQFVAPALGGDTNLLPDAERCKGRGEAAAPKAGGGQDTQTGRPPSRPTGTGINDVTVWTRRARSFEEKSN